jgi:hypothetical protein
MENISSSTTYLTPFSLLCMTIINQTALSIKENSSAIGNFISIHPVKAVHLAKYINHVYPVYISGAAKLVNISIHLPLSCRDLYFFKKLD